MMVFAAAVLCVLVAMVTSVGMLAPSPPPLLGGLERSIRTAAQDSLVLQLLATAALVAATSGLFFCRARRQRIDSKGGRASNLDHPARHRQGLLSSQTRAALYGLFFFCLLYCSLTSDLVAHASSDFLFWADVLVDASERRMVGYSPSEVDALASDVATKHAQYGAIVRAWALPPVWAALAIAVLSAGGGRRVLFLGLLLLGYGAWSLEGFSDVVARRIADASRGLPEISGVSVSTLGEVVVQHARSASEQSGYELELVRWSILPLITLGTILVVWRWNVSHSMASRGART